MNPSALRLAAALDASLLTFGGGGLLLVERVTTHGLPQVAVLGRCAEDLVAPLEAAARVQAGGLALNLVGLLAVECDLPAALDFHRRRIGALVAALDAGLPWLGDRPMLARRLPGRAFSPTPVDLPPVPMGPLERNALAAHLPMWSEAEREEAFQRPRWQSCSTGGFEANLWTGVALPAGVLVRVAPLDLPTAAPLSDLLRQALRMATGGPVPLLPLPADPSPLQALARITPDIAAFRGPVEAWEAALRGMAALPAPPHFCARC